MIEIALAGAVLIGMSAALQKYSMGKMKRFSITNLIRNKAWVISIAIGGVGGILYLLSLEKLALWVVQIIFSIYIIIPIIAGAIIFRENIGVRKWVSVILIIGGIILVLS